MPGQSRPTVATRAHSVVTALTSHTTGVPPAMRKGRDTWAWEYRSFVSAGNIAR
jgi:hypothetical protein